MRAVDYLVTLPEVDRAKIAVTGHSRNGKQALMAAAFDERIGAVVPSSGNTGEGNPWRYTTDPFAAESIEQITGNFPHWFHPRLRFFCRQRTQAAGGSELAYGAGSSERTDDGFGFLGITG